MKVKKYKERHTRYSITYMLNHAGKKESGTLSTLNRWSRGKRKISQVM